MSDTAVIGAVINIDVPDLDAAIRFYQDAIGLTLGRRLFDNSVAEMLGAALPIYLLQKDAGSAPSPTAASSRDYARHWTPIHFDFVVSDIDAAVARALAAGARMESGVTDFAWGRLATFADPFGHGFCFVQWSAAGYDAAA